MVKLLLNCGAKQVPNGRGDTPANMLVAKLLLQKGGLLFNHSNLTPLHLVCYNAENPNDRHSKMIQLFLQNGNSQLNIAKSLNAKLFEYNKHVAQKRDRLDKVNGLEQILRLATELI